MHTRSRTDGFTIIELLVVIVLILILAALVILTASGVQAKNRNTARQVGVNTLQGQLETYYAQTNKYPTLANLNDAAWRTANLKKLKTSDVQDPRWDSASPACAAHDKVMLAAVPTANCYSYQVIGTDGSACDNVKVDCAHYTLTAVLEGGGRYVKSSLN